MPSSISTEKINFRIIIALTLYLASLFAANTLGLKIMPFIFGTHLSVSIIFFPFVFLTTDVIGQVYGRRMAKNFVMAGFISVAVFMLYSLISLSAPWSQGGLAFKDSYNTIFSVSLRMSLASLLAYVIGEYQDVLAFFWFKKKLNDKAFWLQSNLSNLWSQFLDTGIFMLVAFIGVYPLKTIILMGLPWWLYKVGMGFVYTPLSYLGIHLLSYENKSQQNQDI
ncbi:queuosine precursor transporter [Candidatus Falkowbacteria bacterium]|nr:queuosine precursor transporter [Candidatus Falkowbacteria bacterium]NCQ12888.1 queuosine precursor transporter [Candidatus Falkowbacteria bacterium]